MGSSGWAESIPGTGIRRDHGRECRSTEDRRPGRRCEATRLDCPWSWWSPDGAGGRVRGRLRGTLSEAKAEKARMALDARKAASRPAAPDHGERTDGGETVGEFFPRWMRQGARGGTRRRKAPWSPYTLENRDRAFRRYIHGQLDTIPLSEVTPRILEDWIDRNLDGKNGHRTVEQAFGAMSAMLGTAANRRIIEWTPATAVDFPARPGSDEREEDPDTAERDFLTIEEYQRLLEATDATNDA